MVSEKNSRRELVWLFLQIALIFLTVVVGAFLFANHEYGNEITKDLKTIAFQVFILWAALYFVKFSEKWNNEKLEALVMPFIKSGEPKGFNFEVVMSFLSNLTIAGLFLVMAVHTSNIDLIAANLLTLVLWTIAIFLILISNINFLYQFVTNDVSRKRFYAIFGITIIVAFSIPIVIAKM